MYRASAILENYFPSHWGGEYPGCCVPIRECFLVVRQVHGEPAPDGVHTHNRLIKISSIPIWQMAVLCDMSSVFDRSET